MADGELVAPEQTPGVLAHDRVPGVPVDEPAPGVAADEAAPGNVAPGGPADGPAPGVAADEAARVGLPRRAKQLIGFSMAAGAVAIAIAVHDVVGRPPLPGDRAAVFFVLVTLTAADWLWPLIIYSGEESEAVHLDEAGLVIMALTVPAGWTLLGLTAATLAAQLVRGRSLVKTGFNLGQFALATGLALIVSRAIATPSEHLTLAATAATLAGAAMFFLVSTSMVTAILTATGTPWRDSIFQGMFVRLILAVSSVAVGIVIALAISSYWWSIFIGLPLLPILRQVLAAQFSALHDRTRLRGLLDAMLVVNRNLSRDDVLDEIFDAVRRLLRCPDVRILDAPPATEQLAARMAVGQQVYWLAASGRSRGEPFDAADAALLDTLAAVGGGALTNSLLYQQVNYERERLEAITSSLGEGVCAVDPTGALTFFNPAAAQMLGWPADAAPLEHVLRVDDFLNEPAQLAIATGQPVRDEDATFFDGDGRPVPVAYTASAIIDENQPVGAVISFRDLTDRKVFEQERATTQAERAALEAQLHQSQRLESLGQLAGGVAHDFNNLLGVISNSAFFVREQVTEAAAISGDEEWVTAVQDVEQIEDAVRRAAALTHQLLAFARREKVEPRVIDLNQLVGGVEKLLQRSLGARVDLSATLDDRLGMVKVDPGQLEQVVVNLLVNARDAMPNGGRLSIVTDDLDTNESIPGQLADIPPGHYARLRVIDSGTGIPPELMSKVLEPFFTTKAQGEGSGLGLATVYGIVAQAGGHLQLESTVGVGTTVTVLLPVTTQSIDAVAHLAPSHRSRAGGTVLVVEDEPALREVTRRLLERNDYDVLVAADGDAAVALAAHHDGEIDLLLTDVVMPVMLGVEVARRITEQRPGTGVLYMSGYAQTLLPTDDDAGETVSLVEKPFTETTLLAKVREVLAQRAAAKTTKPRAG